MSFLGFTFCWRAFTTVVLLSLLAACSGGGGGSGGSGRTTGTGIRLIHGAIDGSPLAVKIDDEIVQQAAFAEVTGYVEVPKGAHMVVAERANLPNGSAAEFASEFAEKTEYTFFVYGEVGRSGFTFNLMADPVSRPERGMARVQLLNAVAGSSGVYLDVDGQSYGPVALGWTSGFVDTTSGAKTFVIKSARGTRIADFAWDLADRGELTLLLTGSESLGLRFVRAYPDLD